MNFSLVWVLCFGALCCGATAFPSQIHSSELDSAIRTAWQRDVELTALELQQQRTQQEINLSYAWPEPELRLGAEAHWDDDGQTHQIEAAARFPIAHPSQRSAEQNQARASDMSRRHRVALRRWELTQRVRELHVNILTAQHVVRVSASLAQIASEREELTKRLAHIGTVNRGEALRQSLVAARARIELQEHTQDLQRFLTSWNGLVGEAQPPHQILLSATVDALAVCQSEAIANHPDAYLLTSARYQSKALDAAANHGCIGLTFVEVRAAHGIEDNSDEVGLRLGIGFPLHRLPPAPPVLKRADNHMRWRKLMHSSVRASWMDDASASAALDKHLRNSTSLAGEVLPILTNNVHNDPALVLDLRKELAELELTTARLTGAVWQARVRLLTAIGNIPALQP